MFNMYVEINHPTIKRFLVSATAYEEGGIAIVFRQPDPELLQAILQKARETIHPSLLKIFNNKVFACVDMANAEKIYEILKSFGLLTDTDRSNVAVLLERVNKVISHRNSLDYKTNPAQNMILGAVDEVYIDDILRDCKSYEQAVFLISAAFVENFQRNREALLAFLSSEKIDTSIYESIEALSKIVHGQANLETSLSNMGHLPKLQSQRNAVLNHCVEKLAEKFSDLDDADQLLIYVSVFTVGIAKLEHPFSNCKATITRILQNTSSADPALSLDVSVLVASAFTQMGILAKGRIDLVRVQALAEKFNSPMLKKYLEELRLLMESHDNPLQQALKKNDPAGVSAAVQAGQSIEQLFAMVTPLIFAVNSCSAEMVGAVLAHKPKVNALSPSGNFRAIGSALRLKPKDPAKLKLLLEAGASPFLECGAMKVVMPFFQPDPKFRWGTPLELALDEYLVERTPEAAENVRLLLFFGAAINYPNLPLEACHLLSDDMLAIGTEIPEGARCNPIRTLEQFVLRIPREKYPHYFQVVRQAMSHFKAPNLRELITFNNYLSVNLPNHFPTTYACRSIISLTLNFGIAMPEVAANFLGVQLFDRIGKFLNVPCIRQVKEYGRNSAGNISEMGITLEYLTNHVEADVLIPHVNGLLLKTNGVTLAENRIAVKNIPAEGRSRVFVSRKMVEVSQQWDGQKRLLSRENIFVTDADSMKLKEQREHSLKDGVGNIVRIVYEYAAPAVDTYYLIPPGAENLTRLTVEQKEYLHTIAEIYMDDILEKTRNLHHTDTSLFLRAIFVEPTHEHAIHIRRFAAAKKVNPEVCESIMALSEIIFCKVKLKDNAFENGEYPSSGLLAEALVGYCLKRLFDKYPVMDDVTRVFHCLGLMMMLVHVHNPFSDYSQIILRELKGDVLTKEYFGKGLGKMMVAAVKVLGVGDDGEEFNVERLARFVSAFPLPELNAYLEEVKQGAEKERVLTNTASQFFAAHADYSPKIFRRHFSDVSLSFAMFKSERRQAAEELKSTLCDSGLHAYVSEGKEGGTAVYVNLKK